MKNRQGCYSHEKTWTFYLLQLCCHRCFFSRILCEASRSTVRTATVDIAEQVNTSRLLSSRSCFYSKKRHLLLVMSDQKTPIKMIHSSKSDRDSIDANESKAAVVYNELPICIKVNLIRDYETQECSQRSLAKKYQIARATVNQIIKQKERYVTEWEKMKFMAGNKIKPNSTCMKLKRIRKTNIATVNRMMEEYVESAKMNKWEISGPKLKQRAKEIANQLGLHDFKASNGWLDSFKKRCSLEFTSQASERRRKNRKDQSEESSSFDYEAVQLETEPDLPEQPVHDFPSSAGEQYMEPAGNGYVLEYHSPAGEDEASSAIGNLMTENLKLASASRSVENPKSSRCSSKASASSTSMAIKTSKGIKIHAKVRPVVSLNNSPEIEDESQVKAPHIAQVRDAVDIIERFAITKMPALLPSVLTMRQQIGNFIIQQQHHLPISQS